jgi:hypothetical protein
MKSIVSKTLVVIVFFAVLVLPVIVSDKAGGALSPNENRYLAKFPTVINEKNQIAAGLKSGFEAWLKDNLAGREQAQRAKAFIELRCLASSPSPLVHIGENGWYFYTNDHNLEIGMGTHLLSSQELEAIASNQARIQKALKAQGVDYVLVLVPSKASVYPEHISGGRYQVGTTLIDQVTAYLQEYTTIPVINVKPDLLKAKLEQDVYFRTETHWNHAGAYIGYEAIIKRLNELGMINIPPASITTTPATFRGEFSAMMGYPGLLPPEQYRVTVIQNPQAALVSDSDKVNQVVSLMADNEIVGEFFSYSNPSAEKSSLILGDSFFFTWKIPDLFAENFSEMNFIRTDNFVGDIIQVINPDIVILERTERYIYSLANRNNIKLSIPKLNNPSAEIVSHNFPVLMEWGKSYDVSITVKNTGKQSWSEDNEVRLGIFPDGKDTGYRVYLLGGVIVEPGQEFTFVIQNYQIPEPGSTYLEFQMLQEGYQYFGEKERVDIVVK